MIDNESEARDAAEKCGQLFWDLAETISKSFDKIADSGNDPNDYRDFAFNMILVGIPALGEVRAANIVRLAMHRYNLRKGFTTWTPEELYAICGLIANG